MVILRVRPWAPSTRLPMPRPVPSVHGKTRTQPPVPPPWTLWLSQLRQRWSLRLPWLQPPSSAAPFRFRPSFPSNRPILLRHRSQAVGLSDLLRARSFRGFRHSSVDEQWLQHIPDRCRMHLRRRSYSRLWLVVDFPGLPPVRLRLLAAQPRLQQLLQPFLVLSPAGMGAQHQGSKNVQARRC